MIVTISDVIIRINCLAWRERERSGLKTHSMTKCGASTSFSACWGIFFIHKECTLAGFSPNFREWLLLCGLFTCCDDPGLFSQVWHRACDHGHVWTENRGILKRAGETINGDFALWPNWVTEANPLGFITSVKRTRCSYSTLWVLFFSKKMYFHYLNSIREYPYCVLWVFVFIPCKGWLWEWSFIYLDFNSIFPIGVMSFLLPHLFLKPPKKEAKVKGRWRPKYHLS